MAEAAPGLKDQTLRQVVRVSAAGERVRVRLSHQFGAETTHIGAASIGLSLDGADVEPGTLRALTFGGSRATTLAPGDELVSDAVVLSVPAGASLAVSLYLTADSGDATRHRAAQQTSYVGESDQVDAEQFTLSATNTSMHWLAAVEVEALDTPLGIVAFGDSITEGSGSSRDMHNRYPDVLARELAAHGVVAAVANAGIGGNRS